MSPEATAQHPLTPAHKGLAPIHPSPPRATPLLSAVSVSALLDSGPSTSRPLLSQSSLFRQPCAPCQSPCSSPPNSIHSAAQSSRQDPASSTPRSSATTTTTTAVTSESSTRSQTPCSSRHAPHVRRQSSTPGLISRKGKEKERESMVGESVDVEARGEMVGGGPGATMGLREMVRRATVGDDQRPGFGRASSRQEQAADLIEVGTTGHGTYSPRRYHVLTDAGKPVFSSPQGSSESADNLSSLMGVASALISIFAQDDDRLRCIVRGRNRIAFLVKPPLYLFCVSDWGEPEHVLRVHLEYIHLQILSVVSSTQLSRAFQRRSNFDLSRLLEGTDNFLHALVEKCQTDFSYQTSTLQPLRMAPALRDTAAAALMPPARFKDLLYVLLIADGRIVTLLRPRKHSIHPSDLHLLLNALETSTMLKETESWVPMCFPKFNPAGFVHAYVSYDLEDVGLVFVSADREAFEGLRGWKEIVLKKLEQDKTLLKIQQSIPEHAYSVSTLSCPGLRHFIYKSRTHVQLTAPMWEGQYKDGSTDQKRLLTLYQKLNDTVHARSGQTAPLRLVYIRTEHEAVLAWVTKPFELYLAVSSHLSKAAVVAAANTVARWVASEEAKLFIKDAPVF